MHSKAKSWSLPNIFELPSTSINHLMIAKVLCILYWFVILLRKAIETVVCELLMC